MRHVECFRYGLKVFLAVLLVTGTASAGMASNRAIDSLKRLLPVTRKISHKAVLYTTLAKSYEHENIDSAIFYAKKGVAVSQKGNYIPGLAESYADLGDFYVIKNNLEKAKTNYLLASTYFKKAKDIHSYAQVLLILGNIHLAQNEYVEALKLYLQCLDLSRENNFTQFIPNLYNNLGVLYMKIGDYDGAKDYFEKAYRLFLKNGFDNDAALAMSNIAKINAETNRYEEAVQGYLEANKIFYKKNHWINISGNYNSISEIYLKTNKIKKAEEYLNLALATLQNKNKFYRGPSAINTVEIYTNAARLYYRKKEYTKAKAFAKKALRLSYGNSFKESIFENAKVISRIFDSQGEIDSAYAYYKTFVKYYEDFQNGYDLKRITQIRMQHEFNKILYQKQKEEILYRSKEKRKELIYIIIIVSALLTGVIIFLLYLNQKNISAKALLKEENLRLEKQQLENDLKYKNRELIIDRMYLIEKNEFIISITKKLMEVQKTSKKGNQEVIQQLINELNKNSTTKIWKEFEVRFKQVHGEFYKKLNSRFPDLTPNELKICAFLRLNMSTKEISTITHQSVKSINMARFRLRKKLGIDRDENLISYLSRL